MPIAGRRGPELLAPAGDVDALHAALQSGADAVYFGLQEGFNARARAGNFALETLPATVESIHAAGARAYLALNTLIFEPELAYVERVVRAAAAAGVDALLVQDPAVALAARRLAPGLEIHASTQMTISSPEAAVFARDLGATRVVLPRELSVREIGTFVEGAPIETEVFVHGALCVAWSGQCLTSEAWGGRSANRGQCAQSCRLPYDLILDGERRDLGDVRYLLSPKDMAGVAAIPELVRLGVHGLKVEGRQKGAAYVATAVSTYRRWLDAVLEGRSGTPAARLALETDLAATSLAYTRGFGDGFLAGDDHQTLVEGRFPKHRGIFLGRVQRIAAHAVHVEPDPEGRPWTGALAGGDRSQGPQGSTTVSLPVAGSTAARGRARLSNVDIRPGMGVVFDSGHPEDPHEPGGPVFHAERHGDRWVLGFGTPGPALHRVRPGDRVWVTSDPDVGRATDRLVRAQLPRQPRRVDLEVRGAVGRPLWLRARTAGGDAVVETTTEATPATGAGLDEAVLRGKLGALGGSGFELGRLDTHGLTPGLHVPVSELKRARRALVERLDATSWAPAATVAKSTELPERPHFALPALALPDARPQLVPLCRNPEQLEAAIAVGIQEVELDWMEMLGLGAAVARARAAGLRVTLATLRVQKPGEEAFDGRLARLEPEGVLVRHWGGMVAFARRRADHPERSARLRIHGDFSLNVTNSITAHHLFGWGLDTLTASHDLDDAQLFALLDQVPAERVEVVVHHRIPTFHTEHCVYAHLLSNGRDDRTCGRPCEAHEIGLQDASGRVHPVIVDAGCRNTVFNSEVQSAARLVPRLLQAGVRRLRVEFVREDRGEAATVLAQYAALIAGRTTAERLLVEVGAVPQQGVSRRSMELSS